MDAAIKGKESYLHRLFMAIALYEMKLVLATVISRCSLAISGNQAVKPVRRGITSHLRAVNGWLQPSVILLSNLLVAKVKALWKQKNLAQLMN